MTRYFFIIIFTILIPVRLFAFTEIAEYPDLYDQASYYWQLEDLTDTIGAIDWTNNNSVSFNSGLFNNGADTGLSNTKYLSYDAILTNSSFTVCGWFALNDLPSTSEEYDLFATGEWNVNPYLAHVIAYYNNSGTKEMRWITSSNGGSSRLIATTTDLEVSDWHFVCGLYSASENSFYFDGSLIGTSSASISGGSSCCGAGSAIGAMYYGTGQANQTNAQFDDWTFYDLLLTSEEISDYYNYTEGGGGGYTVSTTTGSSSIPLFDLYFDENKSSIMRLIATALSFAFIILLLKSLVIWFYKVLKTYL